MYANVHTATRSRLLNHRTDDYALAGFALANERKTRRCEFSLKDAFKPLSDTEMNALDDWYATIAIKGTPVCSVGAESEGLALVGSAEASDAYESEDESISDDDDTTGEDTSDVTVATVASRSKEDARDDPDFFGGATDTDSESDSELCRSLRKSVPSKRYVDAIRQLQKGA